LSWWGTHLFLERRAGFQRNIYWGQFYYYANQVQIEKVESALVGLQRLLPNNGTITAQLQAIRAREAPATDPFVVRLIMRTHYLAGRHGLAAREASKLLAQSPHDWEALCFLINDALIRKDETTVRRYLAELPRPGEVGDLPLWSAPYALELFKRLGETARYNEMVEFVTLNFLPHLGDKQFQD